MAQQDGGAWETLAIVKMAMDKSYNPVVVVITKSRNDEALSFQFGLMRNGRVEQVRFLRDDKILSMAALAKAVAELAFEKKLLGEKYDAEAIRGIVKNNPFYALVEEYMTYEKKKASMTLGDRMKIR